MHRNKLLDLLGRYQACHPGEDVTRFLRFVQRQPRCFERDCFDDGHVTGSAVVLDTAGASMLFTHHARLGKWVQLGGHADGEPDPLVIACREAEEESGLAVAPLSADAVDLDIHAIPAHRGEPAHVHYDARFLLQADGSNRFTVTAESLALQWVPLHDVAAVTREPSILRMVAKCRELLREMPYSRAP